MASLLPKPSSSATKTLATTRLLLLRRFSTVNHNNRHRETHKFETPNEFLNSWDPPKNPKEAQSKLALLRRQYGKQVKEIRKEYIQEMEALRLEKLQKDEAKMEALRKLNEEHKIAKLAAKKLKAAERKVFEDEFRLTLLKERTEKLEYWREREKLMLEKKEKKNALLRQQSSIWIDESELEKKITEATVDTIAL